MKSIGFVAAVVIGGWLGGCIQAPTTAVLERVDVTPAGAAAVVAKGKLIVFSAYETGLPSPAEIDSDLKHFSDYEVRGDGGQLVAKVKNRSGARGEGPATLELPPGAYQLSAEADGYGRITIPVVISGEQATIVHLEGGAALPGQSDFAETYLVRLPGGRTLGWCATTWTDRPR